MGNCSESISILACYEFMMRLPDSGPFQKYGFQLFTGQPYNTIVHYHSYFRIDTDTRFYKPDLDSTGEVGCYCKAMDPVANIGVHEHEK